MDKTALNAYKKLKISHEIISLKNQKFNEGKMVK